MRLLHRHAEHRLPVEAMFDDCEIPCALIGPEGQVARAGRGFLRLLGVAEVNSLRPFLALPAFARLVTGVAEGVEVAIETEFRTASGAAPVRLRLLPLQDTPGLMLLRAVSLARVRHLEGALEETRRLTDVGRLAGGVAHDFNNLLTAILGAVEDLLGRAAETDRPDLEQIRDSARRGAALVRQLLALGRQQTLQPRIVPLNTALGALEPLLRRLVGGGITLRWALELPTRFVCIDPAQLDQVIVNLAVNARDAMPDGGTLTIATCRRLLLDPVEEGGERIPPGRYAEISVRDTGAGIPPEVLPRLFTPFFTTKPQGGTGLGLPTVQGIVHQSGGYLTVRPGVGEGAEFRILLPHVTPGVAAPAGAPGTPAGPTAVPRDTTGMIARNGVKDGAPDVALDEVQDGPPESAQHSAAGPKPPGTVLLVDDEAAVRALAARALRRAGWQVVEASNAEDALDLAPAVFEAVVSDVVMPGLDGPGLVAALRAVRPGLPALLVSGYAGPAQRAALAAADIRFLAKPFTPSELVAAAAGLV